MARIARTITKDIEGGMIRSIVPIQGGVEVAKNSAMIRAERMIEQGVNPLFAFARSILPADSSAA